MPGCSGFSNRTSVRLAANSSNSSGFSLGKVLCKRLKNVNEEAGWNAASLECVLNMLHAAACKVQALHWTLLKRSKSNTPKSSPSSEV